MLTFLVLAGAAMLYSCSHIYVSAEHDASYSKEFADMQERHIKAAMKHGSPKAPFKCMPTDYESAGLVKVK